MATFDTHVVVPSVSFATRAAVSAIVSPRPGRYVHCGEVSAFYVLATSSATVDGWTVLSSSTAGARWLLVGDRVTLSPSWTLLASAVAACASKATIILGPGTWLCDATLSLPSGTTIVGQSCVTIVASLTPSGGSTIVRPVFLAAPAASTVSTTLTTATTAGAKTLVVNDATGFSVGMEIAVSVDRMYRCRTIRDIQGTTITVDEPIWESFPVGATVSDRTCPRDIRILGGNMTVSGTFDAIAQFSSVLRGSVEDVHGFGTTGSSGVCGFSFDSGCRLPRLTGCTFDGLDVFNEGAHLESSEYGTFSNCRMRRSVAYGFFVTTGIGLSLNDCHAVTNRGASGARGGFQLAAADNAGTGANSITLKGCTSMDVTGIGFNVVSGGNRIRILGCEARHMSSTGFAINSGTGVSGDCLLTACHAHDCQTGFYVVASSVGTIMVACEANACSTYGLLVEGKAQVDGFVSRECVSGAIQTRSTGRLQLTNFDISAAFNGAANLIRMEGSSEVRATDGLITMSGTGTKIAVSHASTGLFYSRGVVGSGGAFGLVTSTGAFRRGAGTIFAGADSVSASGVRSYGALTLAGTTPQTLSWPLATSSDEPKHRRSANGGTPGHYTVTIVAGTGIRVTGSTGDTSTIAVSIE